MTRQALMGFWNAVREAVGLEASRETLKEEAVRRILQDPSLEAAVVDQWAEENASTQRALAAGIDPELPRPPAIYGNALRYGQLGPLELAAACDSYSHRMRRIPVRVARGDRVAAHIYRQVATGTPPAEGELGIDYLARTGAPAELVAWVTGRQVA